MLDLSSLLKLLPVVGPVIAATDEFVAVFNAAKDTLTKPQDKETAAAALDLAASRAAAAHRELQDLILKHS